MMTNSLIGRTFTNLTVLSLDSETSGGKKKYVCQCSCGKTVSVRGSHLTDGLIKSCSCYAISVNTKHGMNKTRTYGIWEGIVRRCASKSTRKKDVRYKTLGMDDRWKSFTAFFSDMGEAPTGMSIDRINNDAGYSKENCRWTTQYEQSRNTSRNILITINDEKLCATDAAKLLGLSKSCITHRIKAGWSDEKIASTPMKIYNVSNQKEFS